MATATIDPGMAKIRKIWAAKQAAGMTLQELGLRMGFPAKSAKQSAHQFLAAEDCRLSSLRRFARAVNVPLVRLVR